MYLSPRIITKVRHILHRVSTAKLYSESSRLLNNTKKYKNNLTLLALRYYIFPVEQAESEGEWEDRTVLVALEGNCHGSVGSAMYSSLCDC